MLNASSDLPHFQNLGACSPHTLLLATVSWPLFHLSEHSSSIQTMLDSVSKLLNFLLQSVLVLVHGLFVVLELFVELLSLLMQGVTFAVCQPSWH